MIPASLLGTLIGCIQQRVHFRLLEICNCRLRCSLAWNGAELPTPLDTLGAMQPNKASQRVNRGQPLVPCGHSTLTGFLYVPKKAPYGVRRDVQHRNFVDFLSCVSSYER